MEKRENNLEYIYSLFDILKITVLPNAYFIFIYQNIIFSIRWQANILQ